MIKHSTSIDELCQHAESKIAKLAATVDDFSLSVQALDALRCINAYRVYSSPEQFVFETNQAVNLDAVKLLWKHLSQFDEEQLSNIALQCVHDSFSNI